MEVKNTKFGTVQEWEEDGSINRFFVDHYLKVYRYYKNNGYKRYENNGRIENHPLEGKKVIFPDDKEYVVDSVYKHWDKGYYEMIMYYSYSPTECELLCTDIIDGKMYGRSHGTFYYKNINSHCPYVKKEIEKNKNIKII